MDRYYTFWRRLGALLFDGIMLLPVAYVAGIKMDPFNPNSYLLWTAVPIIVGILYNVLLTGLVGQTIGKIVMGIKVMDLDEKHTIGIKRAFYRESVYFIIEIVSLSTLVFRVYGKETVSEDISSIIERVIGTSSICWAVLELVTMLFNTKRRALHDFLASSVVFSLREQRIDLYYEKLEQQRKSL